MCKTWWSFICLLTQWGFFCLCVRLLVCTTAEPPLPGPWCSAAHSAPFPRPRPNPSSSAVSWLWGLSTCQSLWENVLHIMTVQKTCQESDSAHLCSRVPICNSLSSAVSSETHWSHSVLLWFVSPCEPDTQLLNNHDFKTIVTLFISGWKCIVSELVLSSQTSYHMMMMIIDECVYSYLNLADSDSLSGVHLMSDSWFLIHTFNVRLCFLGRPSVSCLSRHYT